MAIFIVIFAEMPTLSYVFSSTDKNNITCIVEIIFHKISPFKILTFAITQRSRRCLTSWILNTDFSFFILVTHELFYDKHVHKTFLNQTIYTFIHF